MPPELVRVVLPSGRQAVYEVNDNHKTPADVRCKGDLKASQIQTMCGEPRWYRWNGQYWELATSDEASDFEAVREFK